MAFKIDWLREAEERAKSGHALFGPSTLPRLFRCVGSTQFCLINKAPNKQTPAAQEGSDCHALAQRAAEHGRPAKIYEGCEFQYMHHGKVRVFEPTAEQCSIVQQYLDFCSELPGEHFIEVRTDLSMHMPIPFQFGSTDHGAIHEVVIYITDLKAGFLFVAVEENGEGNEQLLAYALGFYEEWKDFYHIEEIVIRIAQPRLNNWGEFRTSVEDLLIWAKQLKAVVTAAMKPNAPLTPGKKQCEFCGMSGLCPAQLEYKKQLLDGDFDSFDMDQENVQALSLQDLSKAVESFGFLESWMKSVKRRMYEVLTRGETGTDHKIVESKTRRKYVNEKAAEIYLRDKTMLDDADLFTRKMIGPAAAEKLLKGDTKKEFLAKHVVKPPGVPILAHKSDPRPAYQPGDEFDDFESESNEREENEDG